MPIEVKGPKTAHTRQVRPRQAGGAPRAPDDLEVDPATVAREMYRAAAIAVQRFDLIELGEAVAALQEGRPWPDAGDPARRFFLELARTLAEQ